jgi:hypothetical protein
MMMSTAAMVNAAVGQGGLFAFSDGVLVFWVVEVDWTVVEIMLVADWIIVVCDATVEVTVTVTCDP